MALLDSKQLNPKLTGSFIFSGSAQTFISNQVVIGTPSGSDSTTAHPSASLTIMMGDKKGMMLPSASSDPSGLTTTDSGMMYFLMVLRGYQQVILILKILILQCLQILMVMEPTVLYFLE